MASVHFIVCLAFACFVTDSARAAVCTQEIEAECSIGVDFSKMSQKDVAKICGAYSCFMSKNCEPPTVYATFKEACGSSVDGVCSRGQVMSCMGDIDLSAFQGKKEPSGDDLKDLCRIIPCVTNLDCEVPPDMSGILEMKNYCPGANGGGCDLSKVLACAQEMMDFGTSLNGSMKNLDESACQKLSEAIDCIAEFKKCPIGDEGKKNMEDIPDMDSLSKCCNKMVATKNKCYTSDLEFKDESLVTCKQKETAFSCVMANDPKCDGEAGELIYQVKKEGAEAMKDCKNKGYNVTVSLQIGKPPGGTGMTVLPSASVVFGLMLAMAAWWF